MFSTVLAVFSLAAFATVGSAAPSVSGILTHTDLLHHAGCSTDGALLPRVHGSETHKFVPPNYHPPSFVYGAIGVQNYTCDGATSKYKAAGAVAELFDLSCVLLDPIFHKIPDVAYHEWYNADEHLTIQQVSEFIMKKVPEASAGQHYFIKNEAGEGLSPVWDARISGVKTKGKSEAIIVAKLDTRAPAPTGSQDVDWLALDGVKGHLATRIFRTDTRGGQPPATCSHPDENISVRYYSNYYLYGASL